ncbi:MAG: relaxase/mobilization nuclease domain-containing protein [Ethanoligenens sp.]
MGTTRIIPMHGSEGKSIARAISAHTDYAMNPAKTRGGELISAYECSPETVDLEFAFSKKIYADLTGRTASARKDVVAYQIRQSFKPGEVAPEIANEIGYKLAMEFTKGQHAFIVATHIDKAHVHNHIIFNSTTLDCTHKFNNYGYSIKAVQRISDRLCQEYGLSVVEHPAAKGKHYAEWAAERKGTSWKALLRRTIDEALPGCENFETLLARMREKGYEIKRGKYISFRAVGQERFTRVKTLGADYTEQALSKRLMEQVWQPVPQKRPQHVGAIQRLVDIQAKIQVGKGPGYEHWAKLFNLKEMARTMNFLSEHGISDMEQLRRRVAELQRSFSDELEQMKVAEKRLKEISALRKNYTDYLKTKPVYDTYRKSKRPDAYRDAHEADLLIYEAARRNLAAFNLNQRPDMNALQMEYAELSAKKAALYAKYRQAKQDMLEWQTVQGNVERLLRQSEKTLENQRLSDIER